VRRTIKILYSICFLIVIAMGFIGSLQSLLPFQSLVDTRTTIVQMDSSIPFQSFLINLNGAWERILGKKIVRDVDMQYDVYRLKNGQLSFKSNLYDQSWNSYMLHLLAQTSKKHGANFLFVQSPHKIDKYNNGLPDYVFDGCNQNADQLLSLCKDLNYLDLRDQIYVDGLEYSKLFFNTDHHWTPEAALWGARKILEYCNKHFSYEFTLSALDNKNYCFDRVEKIYLGSQGKRVGLWYAGCDDFTAVYPKESLMQYQVTIPSQELTYTGNYTEVLLDLNYATTKDYYSANNYQAYLKLGDGTGFQELKNLSNESGIKLILFRDSFASATVTFMLPFFSEIDMIDLRYNQNMDIEAYIEGKKPDLVMVMYNPDLLGWSVPFAFGLEETNK